MYLIKEDGTGLYQVPIPTNQTGYSCAEPDFNPDGTVVGFPFGGIDGISLYGKYLLHNINNKTIDTLGFYDSLLNNTRPLSWSSSNKFSAWTGDMEFNGKKGITAVHRPTKLREFILEYKDIKWLDNSFGSPDMMWNNIGNKLYYTGGDIVYFAIDEHKELRIKKGCDSRYYEDITISPDDQHIVVERVDVKRSKPLSNTLEKRHRLFMMDIDGCNERLLIGDE